MYEFMPNHPLHTHLLANPHGFTCPHDNENVRASMPARPLHTHSLGYTHPVMQRTFETNAFGPLLMTKHFSPLMANKTGPGTHVRAVSMGCVARAFV